MDAGLGGDVELAIIRRMIQLIRTHYTGDFNWQSYRLGKVIVLSARPEDNAALEDFMSREFFGTPVLKRESGAPRPPGDIHRPVSRSPTRITVTWSWKRAAPRTRAAPPT